MQDPTELDRLLAKGAAQAEAVSQPKVDQTKELMGLVLPAEKRQPAGVNKRAATEGGAV
jgi:hypothetical protein